MSLSAPEPPLVGLVRRIVRGTKTGSAIDRYDVALLWDLGEALDSSGDHKPMSRTAEASVLDQLEAAGFEVGPTLIRNAQRVRRYWVRREEFLPVAASIGSYGKLKEILVLFDPKVRIPPQELERLKAKAKDSTYVDTLAFASGLKRRYIKGLDDGLPDTDALGEAVHGALGLLKGVVSRTDEKALNALREALGAEASRILRLAISALQNPDVAAKYHLQLQRDALPSPDAVEMVGHHELAAVIRMLEPIRRGDPRLFPRIADEVGRPYLGELATLLKASESPAEARRYLKNQEVLRKFALGSGPAGG